MCDKNKDAKEFMAYLQNDPDYRRMMAKKEEERKTLLKLVQEDDQVCPYLKTVFLDKCLP